jgi:glycosyltransferase involved in cell wall biosynthesis
VGGIPEVIADGVNGLLVAPCDVNGLAERMILLMQDDELRRRMGMAAVEKAKLFDVNAGVSATVRLYLEMINSHV